MAKVSAVPDDARALLRSPPLWAATVFEHPVPFFHAWLWRWYAAEHIKNLCFVMPAGHSKTTVFSGEGPLYWLARDRSLKIGVIQKVVSDSEDVLAGLQAEFEGNENLLSLYGNFKPPDRKPGYPWSTEKMRVDGNPPVGGGGLRNKTHNLHAWGMFSDGILGKRHDIINMDDGVSRKNAATQTLRDRQWLWFNEVVRKCLIGSNLKLTRVYGTPFFYDDIYGRIRDMATTVIKPGDWREPDDPTIDASGWVYIHLDAEVGREPGKTLWPFQMDWEDLQQEKRTSGITSYLTRLRCIVTNTENAIFTEESIRGGEVKELGVTYPKDNCLDRSRSFGDRDPSWHVVAGADPASGSDTAAAAEFGHVVLGKSKKKEDENIYIVDLFSGQLKQITKEDRGGDPPDGKSQIGTIIHRHRKYMARYVVIEKNGVQQAWIDALKAVAPDIGWRNHWTGVNKMDSDVGVPNMAALIEAGLLKIPYRTREDRLLADKLIEQLIRFTGRKSSSNTDLVMALWFAVLHMGRRRSKVTRASYKDIVAGARQIVIKRDKREVA